MFKSMHKGIYCILGKVYLSELITVQLACTSEGNPL